MKIFYSFDFCFTSSNEQQQIPAPAKPTGPRLGYTNTEQKYRTEQPNGDRKCIHISQLF